MRGPASLINEVHPTTTSYNTSESVGRPQLMTFAAGDDDVWIDFTAAMQRRNLSQDGRHSPASNLSRPGTALPPVHEYLLIDLGPFSHVTRPGYIFHWIKSAMGFFILTVPGGPGLRLGFPSHRLSVTALARHVE